MTEINSTGDDTVEISLVTAAQGEALTRPADDTTIGKRREELNDELKRGKWYKELMKKVAKGEIPREEVDKIVRDHGVR